MTAPVVGRMKLDKTEYTPGEQAILIFNAYDPDTKQRGLTTRVVDSSGRVWVKVSQQGRTQTWTATV